MGSESFTWPESFGFINEFLIFVFFILPRGVSGASRFVLSTAGAPGTAGFEPGRPPLSLVPSPVALCVGRGDTLYR